MPPGRGNRVLATLVIAMLVTAGAGVDSGAGEGALPARHPVARPAARGGPPLVVLLGAHVVRHAPRAGARRIGFVAGRRPLTHVRTVLPVVGRATAPSGGSWVPVRLPGRPNGHEGWISADHTRRASTAWSVAVSVAHRTVTVTHGDRVEGRFRAVVGRHSTPTPRGHFFVEEIVPLGRLGGPYALAMSARSRVFQQFDGGPGQVAVHSRAGLAGAPGTAVSNGCIRLSARAVRWLARRIRPGVPLTVVR